MGYRFTLFGGMALVDRIAWENKLISIVDDSLSYNPPKEKSSKNEFINTANEFGTKLMNHIKHSVDGLSETDKGAFLIKTFATVFVKAAEMGRQEAKAEVMLSDIFKEKI